MAMILPRLYVETMIPSCLTARHSRDVTLAGQQEITRRWWERIRATRRKLMKEREFESLVVREEPPEN